MVFSLPIGITVEGGGGGQRQETQEVWERAEPVAEQQDILRDAVQPGQEAGRGRARLLQ